MIAVCGGYQRVYHCKAAAARPYHQRIDLEFQDIGAGEEQVAEAYRCLRQGIHVGGGFAASIQSPSPGSTPDWSSIMPTQAVTRGATERVRAAGVGSNSASWVSWP